MAEAVLGVVTAILDKLLPLAADEISRAWGVKEELEKLSQKVEVIQALLSDVKRKQLTSSNIVQLWLKKLQSIALDAEIVLNDFGYEVLRQKVENRKRDKVRNFFSSSNPVFFRPRMANKIKNVSSSLEEVFKEASLIGLRPVELIMTSPDLTEDRVTVPFVDESEIVGRKDDVSKVVSMLISSDYKKDLPVISIVGMAGQGKTALAQLVRKDDNVMKHFNERIWVCASEDFEVEKLLNEMLKSLGGTSDEKTNSEGLVKRLQEKLKGKRYLLVLDDIWNEETEKWGRLRACLLAIGSQGSKILATTRSNVVASVMQTSVSYQLDVLLEHYSWILFEKLAFANGGARKTQDLVDIGRRILKRCGGVPLAIRAIGGLLYSKKDQSEWLMIEKSEIWNDGSSIADGVFSALKLSYEHLPSLSVKQCFASCSIFPKDSVIWKEDLIQIWMAQGLISHPNRGHLQMEEIGSNYFNILLRCSLLQNPEKDIYDDIISCEMHDLVHDFSLEVSNNYIFDTTEDGLVMNKDAEVVRLTLISREGKELKNMKGIPPKLRTLYLVSDVVPQDFLKRFRYLCVLKLTCWNATDLPNAVGEMKHLRYLDILETEISTLPDSITKLFYLMTLSVNDLKAIPKGFGNLVNLRHFYFYEISEGCLLPGVGQLTNLQTLSIFVVSQDEGCQIEELGRLHNLEGEIKIYGLQNVSSGESAANANLYGKSNIRHLKLGWDITEEDWEDSTDVMEGLQPHSNLKSLTIEGFNGSKLPSWILLPNLVKIELLWLFNCEQLPSFGELPYLQILKMKGLHNVKCIGSEFYGRENLQNARKGSCSCEAKAITLFPALKVLKLQGMYSLVEWTDAMIPSDSSSIKVFPNLEELKLKYIPKLAVLPDMGNLTCLQQLSLCGCTSLTCLTNLNSLNSLQKLFIICCPSLDASNLEATNLRELSLSSHFNDINFRLPFSISCALTPTNDADGIKQHFVSLQALYLLGESNISSLPQQIQHLSTVRWFSIQGFGKLEALPEWLGSFQDLECLRIWGCPNLKQLPSVEAMNRLTNLQKLDIKECPLLVERYTRGIGAEWQKIAHIPSIEIE